MFRGNYKPKNDVGQPILYSRNDVVVYQGKVYECVDTTIDSPLQNLSKWKITATSQPVISDNPPLKPIENQIWISTSGRQYVYYKDVNGYQWIET
jgi:hypothetical protein